MPEDGAMSGTKMMDYPQREMLQFDTHPQDSLRQLFAALARKFGHGWQGGIYGPDGVRLWQEGSGFSVIISDAAFGGVKWRHASIANKSRMPSYLDLCALHRIAFGVDGYAYQQFVPMSAHVNIHSYALHLWGRVDGQPGQPPVIIGGSV